MAEVVLAGVGVYLIEALKRDRRARWVSVHSDQRNRWLAVCVAVLGAIGAQIVTARSGVPLTGWSFAFAVLTQAVLQQVLYDLCLHRTKGPAR